MEDDAYYSSGGAQTNYAHSEWKEKRRFAMVFDRRLNHFECDWEVRLILCKDRGSKELIPFFSRQGSNHFDFIHEM